MERNVAFAAVIIALLTLVGCSSDSGTIDLPESSSARVRIPPAQVVSLPVTTMAPAALRDDCVGCHADVHATWTDGSHGNTQNDVADELAEERAGETPADVIHGADPEDCIACHAPTYGATMDDTAALQTFFTTTNGVFTENTAATSSPDWGSWPDVACTACHEVPADHPVAADAQIAAFNSVSASYTQVESTNELCGQCHGTLMFPDTDHVTYDHWKASPHGDTQGAVAGELSEERAGETPDDVIHGADAENCIACHGPTAVTADKGMSESEALAYFFTTDNGTFGEATVSDHSDEWSDVGCATCHNAHDPGHTVLFDSSTGAYAPVDGSSELCGQCHGSLRFADTDHLTYDAWGRSSHSDTQADVAAELSEERAGETPDQVINGDDPENCIACHGPTAVRADGGMTESEALSYFFTTDGGTFGSATAPAHASERPSVGCTACHDPHQPTVPSLFDSSSGEYTSMDDSAQLCGQCHGNLRFPDTDHLSYNVLFATEDAGDTGVEASRTMPMTTCNSCHMYADDVDGSNSSMEHGHSWAIFVDEADGSSTASCSQCHSSFSADDARGMIASWQDSFASLHDTVAGVVERAATAMEGVDDTDLQAKLDEATGNLALAEGDESGGFHNHNYLMSLLENAQARAEEVLGALGK